jgi:hypothetical protein
MAATIAVPVWQLSNVVCNEKCQICNKTFRDLAGLGSHAKRRGSVDGGGENRFADTHPELADSESEDQREVYGRRRTRIEVCRQSNGSAGVEQSPRGGLPGFPEKKHRPGKKRRNGSGVRQCSNTSIRDGSEMVSRDCVELCCKLGATGRFQLVCVQLHIQSGPRGSGENAARFVHGEDTGLTKHIRKAGEPLSCDDRQHFMNQNSDVLVSPVLPCAVLQRNLVRTQPCGDQTKVHLLRQSRDHTESFELVIQRKPVPRFDLECRRTIGSDRQQPRKRSSKKVILCARSQVADGRMDSPSPAGDIHVTDTSRAKFLLLIASTAKDRVRVRIDETGCEHMSAAVYTLGFWVASLEIAARSHRSDELTHDRDGSVSFDTQVTHLLPAARTGRSRARDNLRGIDEQLRAQILSWIVHTRDDVPSP